MIIKIKFFIRVSKKQNEANIRVRVTGGKSFDLYALTGYAVNQEYWNDNKGVAKEIAGYVDGEKINIGLSNLEGQIKSEFYKLVDKKNVDSDWLKQVVEFHHNPKIKSNNENSLFSYMQNFVDNSNTRINLASGKIVCYKMRREYEVTFNYLKEFSEVRKYEPDFDDIDLKFYNDFVAFLKNKNLALNTVGKKIQTLKIFLNSATQDGINKNMKFMSNKFKSLSEENDNIYLTKEELIQLYQHDFSDKTYLEKVRDMFVIASFTGVRFGDLRQITKDKINGQILTIIPNKTSHKVFIPLHSTVIEILNKYNYVLPKPISNKNYNLYLKEAAEIANINSTFTKKRTQGNDVIKTTAPKYKLISSHTARRSFCTNAYKDNISTLDIMAISGHRTEKAFLKYIKVDGEEHAQRVLRHWDKNVTI